MAALSNEVKAFIVQHLACYETPSAVVEFVKQEFGVITTKQQIELYDPTKANGKALGKVWVDLFQATRARFQCVVSDTPIANKVCRLRILDRMARRTESMGNYALTAKIMTQAAKEVGHAYTNQQKQRRSRG
ncbi:MULTISPECIES: DUF2280 domain-containing protein [unclassified Serratia (in: enterobacteria)]|uniref:DUF2280 domain-containing protein n=1 Tax=unclassified Serratia (in: enterobacteria) TaxID=2647522 RepID=UPI00068A314A|nr:MULTISPECIES: DUF2280 domain-containing protein [unclassified Serratia (in: enterobacteria)]